MGKNVNKKKLSEFFMRRKLNLLSLVSITLLSIAVTVLCLITGFIRTKREECRRIAAVPHPAEFEKYYNL